MAQYKRLPRKNVKTKRDEFVSFIDHALHYFEKYRGAIIGGVLVVLLTLASLWGVKQYQQSSLQDFSEKFYHLKNNKEPRGNFEEILKEYSLKSEQNQLHIALLQDKISAAKWDEAFNEIDAALGSVSSDFKGLLLLSKISILWQKNQLDEALATIDKEKLTEDALVKFEAQWIKGQLLEATGKKEEAIAVYEQLVTADESHVIQAQKAKERLLYLK